jgi:hypothetical protein
LLNDRGTSRACELLSQRVIPRFGDADDRITDERVSNV